MCECCHRYTQCCGAISVLFDGTLALISCSKGKSSETRHARFLYTSQLFKAVSGYVTGEYRQWVILSAKHGVLNPDETVCPYELSLNSFTRRERMEWSDRTAEQLLKMNLSSVHIFAGRHYRDYLVPLLEAAGVAVSVPLAGLGIGQQLSWYKTKRQQTTE